jgi:hypothetical protein
MIFICRIVKSTQGPVAQSFELWSQQGGKGDWDVQWPEIILCQSRKAFTQPVGIRLHLNKFVDADSLQWRGLPCSPACPLCDQEPDTLQHLLLGCMVAWEVWAWALRCWGKVEWLPEADTELLEWWTNRPCPAAHRREMWTAINYHPGFLVHLEAPERRGHQWCCGLAVRN